MTPKASKADDELREQIVLKLKKAYFNGHTDDIARSNEVIPNDTKLAEAVLTQYADELMQLIQADRQRRTVAVDDEGLREQIEKCFVDTVMAHNDDHPFAVHDNAKETTDRLVVLFAQLKEQLLDEVEKRVIGEDYSYNLGEEEKAMAIHELKAQQRTALDSLRKPDNQADSDTKLA